MPSQVRRSLSLLAVVVLALSLAGCGGSKGEPKASGTPTHALTGPGTNPSENADVGQQFFEAVASGDAAKVTAARDLAAPKSPALKFLSGVRDDLTAGTEHGAGTLTKNTEGYQVCSATDECHQYSAIVLVDGKVNSFTVDGKALATITHAQQH